MIGVAVVQYIILDGLAEASVSESDRTIKRKKRVHLILREGHFTYT